MLLLNDLSKDFETIKEFAPFLLPIIFIQLLLMIIALVHALRHKNYKVGNRIVWVVLIVFVQIIGPILYFTIGRSED